MRNNPVLQAAISDVLSYQSTTRFNLSLIIQSELDSSFSWEPEIIDRMVHHQNFAEDYCDRINIKMPISPARYAQLYDMYQGLICTLTYTFVDTSGNPVYNPAPIVKQFRVNIVDMQDVRKRIRDAHLRTTPDMNIELQLIEKALYDITKVKLNGIYQSTNLTNCIHHLVSAMGITKLEMAALENVHTYDHILIPPYKSISDIFFYLQGKYGLYSGGVNHYYFNGVLYIYPPFDIMNVKTPAINVYQADQGDYAGMHSYHRMNNGAMGIVSTTLPYVEDHSIVGTETHGTGMMFTRSSLVADGMVNVDPNTGASYTGNPGMIVKYQKALQIGTNYHQLSYAKTTDNPFPQMSKMAESQAVMIHTNWLQPMPYTIPPGSTASYMHDGAGNAVTQLGLVERMTMEFIKGDKGGGGDVFSGSADIILRLRPDAWA